MNEAEVTERYLILLLGVVDQPIPSATHLQKELFTLSQANPRMGRFISFEKHYFGPYSDDVKDAAENPVFNRDAYVIDDRNKLVLTHEGRRKFDVLISENSEEPRFTELLSMMRMVRELYERLTVDELLFLIYVTYEEYTERSDKSKELLSPGRSRKLSNELLRKGVITRRRYEELVS
jgi:hypothetical protein